MGTTPEKYQFKILFIAFITISSFNVFGQQAIFTDIQLQPTIAYLKYNGESRRMVRLIFKNGKNYQKGEISVSFNNLTEKISIAANKQGAAYWEIPLPGIPVTKATQATVSVSFNRQTYTARCIVEPSRSWNIYVLPHSHVDIGYTNTQAKVLKLHMDNIDESIALAEKTKDYPASARFKWTTEAMWVVDNYLMLASQEKKDRFWNAVKKGWISLDGAYGNINTSLTDSKQLMQMFAKSQKLAKEQGIEINTLFQGDVPGASWGLAAQVEQTGIRYFLSGPNASDRIGNLAKWQDKPFYWLSPSGKQKLLFWQCQPYSLGYQLKGDKIPNFFTIKDPKPFYTGHPSENFLNPYLFNYLDELAQKGFPYDMSILTWAMSDNAPIDPELPDAVKAWNEKYASPQLIITSTKQFFTDFEQKYAAKIPSFAGDYTEYWTDGVSSAAKETALNRNLSDQLKQADAIWAIRNKSSYPVQSFDESWKNLLLFNEHTWGAFNSVSHPDDEKVKSEWAVKQSYVLKAKDIIDTLTAQSLKSERSKDNQVDVYNTVSWSRTNIVYIPASLSEAGDLVKDSSGKPVISQRLSTGELAFIADQVPQMGKSTFSIYPGKAYSRAEKTHNKGGGKNQISANTLNNGVYQIELAPQTGDIKKLIKLANNRNYLSADSAGLNQYLYMPGDSIEKIQSSSNASITFKEKGPLVNSLLITSAAPGTNGITREIRLITGLDQIELINTIDKQAIRRKESVHFAFPFHVPDAKVRYSIPWGSITAETDQLPYSNRNWYTMQRWIDISNNSYGITLSSPDAPLFEIGKITTANLLGGLPHAPLWLSFTPQSSHIYSWVMNNLWHTNFKADQQGPVTFHYFIQAHESGYDSYQANQTGLNNHQPLLVAPAAATLEKGLPFTIQGNNVYVEAVKKAGDGKSIILQLVNCGEKDSEVIIHPKNNSSLGIWESDLLETRKKSLKNQFILPAKEIMTVCIEN
ncbi:glycoside hydrolase family 38 N-terminal domain-containing protein [Pedobacter cryoconitis]|uniref:Alpha-mannosidase n=1 Tax=Pedobacter cryoconitis TaxID=188932 RepID=A0A327T780_9SPHI|nr:glycoside hydrolase family 38 C-terminal domain-containing protein [Pedobacter cryoconitis]RAJ37189.1 alpha-mannosidase [Pedobacter cryoconitis]